MNSLKEKKSFQRTVRMTERVRFILESYEGNGMNEQFENLVLDCNEKLPEIQRKIDKLKEEKIELLSKIENLTELVEDLEDIKYNVENAKQTASNLIKEV